MFVGLLSGAFLIACTPAPPDHLETPGSTPNSDHVSPPAIAPIVTSGSDRPTAPGPALKPSYAQPPIALEASSDQPRIYVAPDGDDSNAGTADAPLRTIKEAATQASPGSTVIVADGTYNGAFQTHVSGRENARITFISATKWGAKLVGDVADEEAVWRNYGDYVDIQGFDITGTTSSGDGIIQTGSYGRIVENRVHGLSKGSCMSVYKEDYSMVDNDFLGNITFDCGSTALDHGIYPGGPGGTISNNISFGNAGFGIHCWHNCNHEVISNNLVFDNGQGGILVGQGDNPNYGDVDANDMIVANNIVIDNRGQQGIRESGATGHNNTYLNNIVNGNAENGIGLQTGTESGTIIDAPRFINFQTDGSGDYRLAPSSPGVNAGTADDAPATDILGVSRPQGGAVDVGVYEQ